MKLKALVASLVTVAIMGTGITAFGQAAQIAVYKVAVSSKMGYAPFWDKTLVTKKMRTNGYMVVPLDSDFDVLDTPYFQPNAASPVLFFYWKEGKETVCQYFGQIDTNNDCSFDWSASLMEYSSTTATAKNAKVAWIISLVGDANQVIPYINGIASVNVNMTGKFNQNLTGTWRLNKLVPSTLSSTHAWFGNLGYTEIGVDANAVEVYTANGRIRASLDVKKSTVSFQAYNTNVSQGGDDATAMVSAADIVAVSLGKKGFVITK